MSSLYGSESLKPQFRPDKSRASVLQFYCSKFQVHRCSRRCLDQWIPIGKLARYSSSRRKANSRHSIHGSRHIGSLGSGRCCCEIQESAPVYRSTGFSGIEGGGDHSSNDDGHVQDGGGQRQMGKGCSPLLVKATAD